jgi:hypothetical protein
MKLDHFSSGFSIKWSWAKIWNNLRALKAILEVELFFKSEVASSWRLDREPQRANSTTGQVKIISEPSTNCFIKFFSANFFWLALSSEWIHLNPLRQISTESTKLHSNWVSYEYHWLALVLSLCILLILRQIILKPDKFWEKNHAWSIWEHMHWLKTKKDWRHSIYWLTAKIRVTTERAMTEERSH